MTDSADEYAKYQRAVLATMRKMENFKKLKLDHRKVLIKHMWDKLNDKVKVKGGKACPDRRASGKGINLTRGEPEHPVGEHHQNRLDSGIPKAASRLMDLISTMQIAHLGYHSGKYLAHGANAAFNGIKSIGSIFL